MKYDITIFFSDGDYIEKTGIDENEMLKIKTEFKFAGDDFISFIDDDETEYLVNPRKISSIEIDEYEEEPETEKNPDNTGLWLLAIIVGFAVASGFVLSYRESISDFFISLFN